MSALAVPIGIYSANPIDVLNSRGFVLALLREEIGVIIMVVALAWAVLAIFPLTG